MVAQGTLARRQVDAIEAGLAAWRADTQATGSDLAALLAAAVHWAAQMGRWQGDSWKRLSSGDRSFDFQSQGGRLAEVYSLGLTTFERLESSLNATKGLRPDAAEVEAFRKAQEALAALGADFQARWPLFTPEELEEGVAEIARGECVALEEAIRELGPPPRQ